MNTITVEKHWTAAITSITSSLLVDLSCVAVDGGVLLAKTTGATAKQVWSVTSWDSLVLVRVSTYLYNVFSYYPMICKVQLLGIKDFSFSTLFSFLFTTETTLVLAQSSTSVTAHQLSLIELSPVDFAETLT